MRRKIPMILLGILTAGAMVAQTAQSPTAQQQQAPAPAHTRVRARAENRQDQMLQRLTARLNLTSDQQNQVRAILKDSREHSKAWVSSFRAERMALDQAVKSDSTRRIDEIMNANVSMNSEVAANHLKTAAKIYAILTPDQKAKFDRRFDRLMGVGTTANGV